MWDIYYHHCLLIYDPPPETPSTPSGPTSGYVSVMYTYSTSTTDPHDDEIRYLFDWGDGTTLWTDWYASGATANASHSWSSTGNYNVRVKAQDIHGPLGASLNSSWSSSLTVEITTKLVNLVIRIPQAPPEGVKVWVDGNAFTAYANAPVSVTVEWGQHTIEAERSFLKEEWTPGTYFFYFFNCWSDGSKDNPRTMQITSDTTLTAYYIRSKYGWNSEQPE